MNERSQQFESSSSIQKNSSVLLHSISGSTLQKLFSAETFKEDQPPKSTIKSPNEDFFIDEEVENKVSSFVEYRNTTDKEVKEALSHQNVMRLNKNETLLREMQQSSNIPQLRERYNTHYALSEAIFLAIYHTLYACVKTRQYETFKVIAPFLNGIKCSASNIVQFLFLFSTE